MFSMKWLRDSAERMIRTFIQAWISAWLVVEDKTLSNLFSEKPLVVGLVAMLGALLFAMGGAQTGDPEDPSFQH